MDEVKITTTSDRGFHRYGEPFCCTYRTRLRVYESSSAEAPHVWLHMQSDLTVLRDEKRGEATAHLNEEQARALIARLQAWLDEIPARRRRERRRGEAVKKIMAKCPRCGGPEYQTDGNELRKLRERAGVSLRETARRFGFSAAHLSDVELNRRRVRGSLEAKYLAAFAKKEPRP